MKKLLAVSTALFISACTHTGTTQLNKELVSPLDETNPFYAPSSLYLQIPAFDQIDNEHFAPAFDAGMRQQLDEIEKIINNPEVASIENTLVPMELSGGLLSRTSRVFFALVSANSNEELKELRKEISPKLSAHRDTIVLNEKLFARVKSLYEQQASLASDPETLRLVKETYNDFIRAGANLSAKDKEKLKDMNTKLAKLQTQFNDNVLDEVNAKAIILDSAEQLDGLPAGQIAAAAEAAKSRDLEGKYVLPLLNTSGQPSLSSLNDRELREQIHTTSLSRGNTGGEFDNREILTAVLKIRAERAQLLGFENHAAYSLSNQTAQTTQAVNERLATITPPAVANARQEAADLQKIMNAEGNDFELASWDWSYYSEKLRAQRYDFDESQLKPYLEMNNVLVNGVFYAAEKVYGLTFKLRPDLPTYHPDVRVWEVFEEDGSTLALFIEDFYARESKRGGAWMNAYVPQSNLLNRKPVVANHLNVSKPPEGQPTLLTWDEVVTMFHEFGHALHGMFSDVQYPAFSGTSVPRDFVEYPSQVNEMWADYIWQRLCLTKLYTN